MNAIVIPNCFNKHGCLPYYEGLTPVNYMDNDGIYVEFDVFREMYGTMEGQIKRGTQLGEIIYKFASNNVGPCQWLDVGTWNGRGTTQCILDGFADSQTNKHCVSLEAHPFMYPISKENLMNHRNFYKLTLLNEVLHFDGAEKYFAPRSSDPEDDHYKLYYETEYEIWKNGTKAQLPYKPDAIVLDGGEYTGYIDWMAIPKDNLKAIFLDDVNCVKNRDVRNELLQDSRWNLLVENLTERNGWSVFVLKN